jgi:hypothetical protein
VGSRVLVRFGSMAIVAAAALAALAMAAPAMAAKQFPQAKFKVEIDGTQFSDWTYNVTSPNDCGNGHTHHTGSGSEDFALTTKKPVKVIATWIKGSGANSVFFSRPNSTIGVPVNVAAGRQGEIQTTQTGETCAVGDGGGGGSAPPPPDCGERSFNSEVRMEHLSPEQYFGDPPVPLVDVLALDGPIDSQGNSSMDDQWQNCPDGPGSGRFEESANGALSKKQIFGKDKKFTVKGKDTQPHTGSYGGQTVSKWKTVFRRLKG